MKNLRANKDFRVFVWTVFNACIMFAIKQLSGLEGTEAVLAVGLGIPFLNALTKYINVRWFNDLGVKK